MPPKIKVSKKEIVSAALEIIRKGGTGALNARTVAAALNCSTQPIFFNYATMEDLKADVKKAAFSEYEAYLHREMEKGEYPPYKASGMSYIRFAGEEKELFRMLFMTDRSMDDRKNEDKSFDEIARLTAKNTGLSEQDARLFHLEMWMYVHGIAVMAATSYWELAKEDISGMLTDAYEGLKLRFYSKEGSA